MKLICRIKGGKIFVLFLWVILSFDCALSQSIPIKLNFQASNQLQTKNQSSDGSYYFKTSADNADPNVYSYDITQKYDPDSVYTISFDYIAPNGLKNMQIYFGPPFSESNSIKPDDLPATTVYKTFNINIRHYTNKWNTAYTKLRFDFGKNQQQEITLKNIFLKKDIDYEALNKNTMVRDYDKSVFQNEIFSVVVNADSVLIKGNFKSNSKNLFLCELHMFDDTKLQYASFDNAIPLSNQTLSFEYKVPRLIKINDATYDRIYSRWVIASKVSSGYSITSYAHYADDIYGAMKQYLPEEKPENKKGLAGFVAASNTVNDIADLGIKNVTVNISLVKLASLSPTEYSFQFNGRRYYFNPSFVNSLDKTFKACSDQNIITSAIILIPRNVNDSLKSIFVFPGSNNGIYSMGNITSLTGINYYAAAIGFLAERYSKPGKAFGRINNWIIHNEVDDGFYWANAGNAEMEYYTELYDRSMRTVYYTVRQYNPSAKVFLSLTHSWIFESKGLSFPPRDMLTFFNDMSTKQGDYEWGIAYHPYAEDITNPETWNDKDVTNDINTSRYITPKNIELIDEWIRTKANLYKGLKIRSLLFSEQGINSKSYSENDLKAQAAGVAYMWKKFNRLPSLEAFDYHHQVDNLNESGFLLGLWTAKQGTVGTPGNKKPSWYVFKNAGTVSEDSAFAFALPVIGINNWPQVYNSLQGDIMPATVSFVLNKQTNTSVPLLLFFNGEMHEIINGKAEFYNVAILSQSRQYMIYQNGKMLGQGNITISKDTTIDISNTVH